MPESVAELKLFAIDRFEISSCLPGLQSIHVSHIRTRVENTFLEFCLCAGCNFIYLCVGRISKRLKCCLQLVINDLCFNAKT